MESNLAYAYTVFHMVDTAAYRYNWDGTTYPAVSEYGGEIGKWASNARNEKHTITHKLHLNYVINNNHSINLNSLFSFASGHPKDDLKIKLLVINQFQKYDGKLDCRTGIRFPHRQ